MSQSVDEIRAEIARLRQLARQYRESAEYADSRAAYQDDLRYAASLEQEIGRLKEQLRQAETAPSA